MTIVLTWATIWPVLKYILIVGVSCFAGAVITSWVIFRNWRMF